MAPSCVKFDEKDFDRLKWQTREGTKANYEQTTKEENQENAEVFRALQKILQEHKGFMQIGDYKFWFHQDDANTIDRRRKV